MAISGEGKFAQLFSSPAEKFICSIGNSYLENFLANGTLSRGFSVLSDKRVYFNGTCFTRSSGGKFSETNETRIVDVKDVTGTGYVKNDPWWMIMVALILPLFWFALFVMLEVVFERELPGTMFTLVILPMVGIAVVFMAMFVLNRRTLFEISFAGGGIAFNTAWLNKTEIDAFQRNIRLAKDAYDERSEKQHADLIAAAVNAPAPAASSGNVADELKKYKDLLDTGVLSQDEFDEAKNKLLGRL